MIYLLYLDYQKKRKEDQINSDKNPPANEHLFVEKSSTTELPNQSPLKNPSESKVNPQNPSQTSNEGDELARPKSHQCKEENTALFLN